MSVSRVEVDGIFEEIDEQLEAENVARLWIKYRQWIIGGLILLFAGLFAYVGWGEYRAKQDQEVAKRYLEAMETLDEGDAITGRKALAAVMTKYGDHGYGLLARFIEAHALVQEGKNEAAALLLEEIAAIAKPPLQNLAIINAAFVISDDATRALRRLDHIPMESVFKPHALELAGVLTVRQGDPKAGLALYREALSLKPTGGLKKRLERRIQRLGG